MCVFCVCTRVGAQDFPCLTERLMSLPSRCEVSVCVHIVAVFVCVSLGVFVCVRVHVHLCVRCVAVLHKWPTFEQAKGERCVRDVRRLNTFYPWSSVGDHYSSSSAP